MESISTRISIHLPQSTAVEKPLVSIVVIFFNAERFLREAIESIFSQTYPAWELLLVNDGSTDGSSEIARSFFEQYPERVRYLEHPGRENRGMSASRNLGIANAQGKYIAFLDADDVWLPDKLQQQVAILESHPEVGMLYGLSQWWYSWTGNREDQDRDFVHQLGVAPDTPIKPPELLSLFFLRQQAAVPNPSSILVRREIVDHIGGFEEEFRGMYEDQAFFAKLGLAATVIAYDETWDRYRQHSESCVSSVQETKQAYAARLYFLNWLAAYLSKQGIRDNEIWRGLQREQWRYRHPSLDGLRSGLSHLIRKVNGAVLRIGRRILPSILRQWLWARIHRQKYIPPAGSVRLGDLRRLTSLSRVYGYDRGQPVDRYYIEKFLSRHQAVIQGSVLDVQDNAYTRQYGGDRVTKSDVLHLEPGHPGVTLVGDLTRSETFPENTYDCVILTQTLQFIFDVPAALNTLYRILKPGGSALVTVPGISPISRYDMDRWGQYWSFTTLSIQRLFEQAFPPDCIQVEAYGNVLASTAFLYGMAAQELSQEELEAQDPDYELIITVRAVKP